MQNTTLAAIATGISLIVLEAMAQPMDLNLLRRYQYAVFPPLLKDRDIVILATENSPRMIKIEWYRANNTLLFAREFNVEQGEKLVISAVPTTTEPTTPP